MAGERIFTPAHPLRAWLPREGEGKKPRAVLFCERHATLLTHEMEQIDWKTDNLLNGLDEEEDDDNEGIIGDESTAPDVNQALKAAEYGDDEQLTSLLRKRPDLINCTDCDGYTPLHRACYNGHLSTIRLLLDAGANIHSRSSDGWQPIHSACRWAQVEAVALLLDAGADINAKTEGSLAPIHLAAEQNNRKLLELILFHPDTDVNAKTDAQEVAYQIAYRSSPLYRLFHLV